MNDENLNQQLELRREEGCNVIVPFDIPEDRVDRFHAFRMVSVSINPNPDAGDVWFTGSRKIGGEWVKNVALSRPALQRIGQAAGIVWDPDRTRRVDDRRNPNYVEFQAVGLFRGPDGQWRTIKGTKEIDLEVIEEEIRDQQYEKMHQKGFKLPEKYGYMKGKPEDEILDFLVRRELLQWRKHKVPRAETGAMLRALRSIGIRSSYPETELEKPFVFVRVDYFPDTEALAAQQVAHLAIEQDKSDLYGGEDTEEGRAAQAQAHEGEQP